MSRGPGRVQRNLLSLLLSNPDVGWTTAELCRRIYIIERVRRSHRKSLTASLKKILPRGWRIDERMGREHFIFNKHSLTSTLHWRCWLRGVTFDQLRESERVKDAAYDAAGTFVKFSRDHAVEQAAELEAEIKTARGRRDLTTKERVELSRLDRRLQLLKRHMDADAKRRIGTEDNGNYLDGDDVIARRHLDGIRANLERISRANKV